MQEEWYDANHLDYLFSKLFNNNVNYSNDIGTTSNAYFYDKEEYLPDVSSDEFSLYGEDDGGEDERKPMRPNSNDKIPLLSFLPPAAAADGTANNNYSTKEEKNHTNNNNGNNNNPNGKRDGERANSSRNMFTLMTSLANVKYRDANATNIMVRSGPDYKKKGYKRPSDVSLYEFRGLDLFKAKNSNLKLSNIMSKFSSNNISLSVTQQVKDFSQRINLPLYFVVNIQIPNKAPSMFSGSSNSSEEGASLVFYFTLRLIEDEKKMEANSIRLFKKFLNRKVSGRFKVIPFVDNLKELKLPSMASTVVDKYNGKPVIINKSGSMHLTSTYLEVDIDIHSFPYVSKTSILALRQYSKVTQARLAFVIQGEEDDELPEQILGACEIYKDLDVELHSAQVFPF